MASLQPFRRSAFHVSLLSALMSISPLVAGAQVKVSLPGLTPSEIQVYQEARTLIDWTAEEVRSRPRTTAPPAADSQRDLPSILQKVGEKVAMLFEDLPNTTCTEKVNSHLRTVVPHAISTANFVRRFRYLLLVHPQEGIPVLEEYRTGLTGNPIDYDRLEHAPIITSRFIWTPLISTRAIKRAAGSVTLAYKRSTDGQVRWWDSHKFRRGILR